MEGLCENCKKNDTCRKIIGSYFGFCTTEFVPKDTKKTETISNIETENK